MIFSSLIFIFNHIRRNTGNFKGICTRNLLEQPKELSYINSLSFLAVSVLPKVLKYSKRGG